MWKYEDIPAISKQDNYQFHAFERRSIKYGQIQEKMNGTIWFLDPQNIVLDIKIIILYK